MCEGAQVIKWSSVGVSRHGGHVVTARSCCLDMLLCNVAWMAAQASLIAVGGVVRVIVGVLMKFLAWYPGLPVDSRDERDQVDAGGICRTFSFLRVWPGGGHEADVRGEWRYKWLYQYVNVMPRNATTMSMRASSVLPFELVCVSPGIECSMCAFTPVCVVMRSARHLARAECRWSSPPPLLQIIQSS